MEAVAVTLVFHRCINSGTNSSVISAPQWMQVIPNRGGYLRVAGLTSPSMGSLPQKGQGFKMYSLISSTSYRQLTLNWYSPQLPSGTWMRV